jgi:glutathione S-transferase
VITLYGNELSAEAYRVRLLLALLNIAHIRKEAASPRLEDGDTVLERSNAMLIHIAEHHDPAKRWRPCGPWLELAPGLPTRDLFRQMDEHLWFAELEGPGWLFGAHPTIADVACFPAVAMSESDGLSRLPFPALRRWVDRVRHLPGFVAMPGIFG